MGVWRVQKTQTWTSESADILSSGNSRVFQVWIWSFNPSFDNSGVLSDDHPAFISYEWKELKPCSTTHKTKIVYNDGISVCIFNSDGSRQVHQFQFWEGCTQVIPYLFCLSSKTSVEFHNIEALLGSRRQFDGGLMRRVENSSFSFRCYPWLKFSEKVISAPIFWSWKSRKSHH